MNANIQTEYDPKPIPDFRFDWEAWWSDRDQDEYSTVGYGSTEAEAIANLIDRSEDR